MILKHLLVSALLIFCFSLSAQINDDSLRTAVYEQAQAYKAQDSLATWVKTYFDAADFDTENYLTYYDSILLQQWRPARDSIEAYALLKTAFFARYYYADFGDIYGSLFGIHYLRTTVVARPVLL